MKHSLMSYNQWHCNQSKCIRIFSDVYSFKKHLITKHPLAIVPEPVVHSYENIETNMNEDVSDTFHNVNSELPQQPLDEPELSIPNFNEFKTALIESSSAFVANLNRHPNITKSITQDVIDYTTELLNSGFMDISKTVHSRCCKDKGCQLCSEMLNAISNPFQGLETVYKREKYLEKSGYLIKPAAFSVGSKEVPKKIRDTTTVMIKDLFLQFIPIDILFQRFLELPGVWNTIKLYMDKSESTEGITSFLNAQLWLDTKAKYPGKFIMPLMLYSDDVEMNNPLGSRKGVNKICGTYCKMLGIPPQYSSMLENIFVVQFHKSHDQRDYGDKHIWRPLVNKFKYLEKKGITIKTEEGTEQIYFVLSLFAGDNLGTHTNFGFHQSFRSNHYCHICRAHKHFLNTATVENSQYLRTKTNFEKDVEDLSHGVLNDTILHEIPNFHITENLYCDPMHDLLEGVCRYLIPKVLNLVINIGNHLSIETLNIRIKFFHQRSRDIPQFTKEHLTNGMYICSASEMKILLENLGFMIGDLVPENNREWELYLCLREIHCSLLDTVITEASVESLRLLIATLNREYQNVFDELLICKLHFLTHYPRIALRNGPLYAVSCMRLEAKHKESKDYARVCRSRKNLCYSLAMKTQISFAERLQAKNGFQVRLKLGRSYEVESHELTNYDSFKDYISHNQLSQYRHTVSFAEINGTNYKPDMILVISKENDSIQFGKIDCILVSEKREIAFILSHLHTKNFIRHVHGFSVEYSSVWSFVEYENLYHYIPRNSHYLKQDDSMIMMVPC